MILLPQQLRIHKPAQGNQLESVNIERGVSFGSRTPYTRVLGATTLEKQVRQYGAEPTSLVNLKSHFPFVICPTVITTREWLKMKLIITLQTQRRKKEALAAFQIEPQVQ